MNLEEIRDYLANNEFGMDYVQLGFSEKEWVNDEIDNRNFYKQKVYKVWENL